MITQSNSIRKRNRRKLGVRLHELERRLMLAADAGAAVCVDSTSTTQVAKPISVEGTRQLTAPEIVFVDHAVENLEHLFSGLDSNADLVLLDAEKKWFGTNHGGFGGSVGCSSHSPDRTWRRGADSARE